MKSNIVRVLSIAFALSFALGNAALALNPQPEPPGVWVKLSDGRELVMNKQFVLFSTTQRKASKPVAPGVYKLPNGHIIKVGPGGVVDPKSRPEILGNKGYT